MEENEVQAQDVYEQEVTSVEVEVDSEVATEDEIKLPKSEYTKLKRQALAYQASKGEKSAEVKRNVETMQKPTGEDDRFTRLELKTDGYSNEEIELISEFGFDKKDNPIVKMAIETMRKERKSKEADVSISGKSTVYKKYSNDDLKNMSVEELRKILPHADN
jgi:ribosomal protein L29